MVDVYKTLCYDLISSNHIKVIEESGLGTNNRVSLDAVCRPIKIPKGLDPSRDCMVPTPALHDGWKTKLPASACNSFCISEVQIKKCGEVQV